MHLLVVVVTILWFALVGLLWYARPDGVLWFWLSLALGVVWFVGFFCYVTRPN